MELLSFSSETNCIAVALYHSIERNGISALTLAGYKDMLGCVLYFGKLRKPKFSFFSSKIGVPISILARAPTTCKYCDNLKPMLWMRNTGVKLIRQTFIELFYEVGRA